MRRWSRERGRRATEASRLSPHRLTLWRHSLGSLEGSEGGGESRSNNDERLVLDLSRGRGRSIGGDLDVGKEGSEQTIVTLQSLHHSSIGYQHVRTRVGFTKKAYPYKCNREHKQEQERMQINLQMNV
jgi:hypothetical protein